jgi:hypothetical protein
MSPRVTMMEKVQGSDRLLCSLLGGETCPFVIAPFDGQLSMLKIGNGLSQPVATPVRSCPNSTRTAVSEQCPDGNE